ncbi:hypothetical protein [Actinokineospora sp.]|uniref:hypothetical protein n=1 Tax=Actinokineospora sp. TaxID=1872133 RepID=UPI0040381A12
MIEFRHPDRTEALRVNTSARHTATVAAAVFTELVGELKALRKGRGTHASRIAERVGPRLREISGMSDDDGPAEIRLKVSRRLEYLANELPADLRAAALAAFAIAPDTRLPLYQDRVGLVAARLRRDPRTARRRVDDAIIQLAQLATARTAVAEPPATGWHTSDLRVMLALDRDRPEAVEQRQVVADQDDLAELMSTPLVAPAWPASDDLAVDVFYGGTLVGHRIGQAGRRTVVLGLPRRLRRGETHEFALRSQVLTARALCPRVGYTPEHRCDRFELRLRFDRAAPPKRIWSLADVSRDLPVDQFGDVHVAVHDLTPGHEYGAAWEW